MNWSRFILCCVGLSIPMTSACQRTTPSQPQPQQVRTAQSQQTAPTNNRPVSKRTVLFLGDSLTAGYQLASQEAYPMLIQAVWKREGSPYQARNAGVSGDTTAGVLRRLDWVVTPDVHTVFLAIGGNDGLRGLKPKQTEANLRKLIQTIRNKGIHVILAGMKLPPNYGPTYVKQFEAMYPKIAKDFGLHLLPFLLEGVAARKQFNLADGIHPNAEGHKRVARHVLAFFRAQKLFRKDQPLTAWPHIPTTTKKPTAPSSAPTTRPTPAR